MAEWSLPDLDCPINHFDPYHYATYPSSCEHEPVPRVPLGPPPQAQPCLPASAAATMALHFAPPLQYGSAAAAPSKGENPREVRNRAEKMRRDRLNQSVADLASMVPPVVAARRKLDKTTVLRLTAHYLRAHQYVFGDSIGKTPRDFSAASIQKVLSMFNGFLITTTYRGIIVVVSQNVNQYLGYNEIDLLGQNLHTITHEADRALLRDQLMPRSQKLGPNGELLIPDEPDAIKKVKRALANEKRAFTIRLKKLGQRSEPSQYITCHVEGSLRKSDRACRTYNRCCQVVRRARARSDNPCSSGNDIVFIGIVRPTSETFINESALESYRMEYRTRHSIDGEIIQCDSRIALVTGYMTHEVSGVNAMNFMHRDDVRWVIIALREMYDQHRLFGESCYRLITKNGQSIYMRTRGCLDVDRDSRAVTSFVCTNTVVDEEEGKQLIKLMKRKFRLLVNNNESPRVDEIEDAHEENEQNDDEAVPVEDPRRLEQVILHLVTNLPSPAPSESTQEPNSSPQKNKSPHHLTIIPPNKERIVSAIEKIYNVIKAVPRDSSHEEGSSYAGSSHSTPKYNNTHQIEPNMAPPQRAPVAPFQSCHVSNYVHVPENSFRYPPPTPNIPQQEFNPPSILNTVASPDLGYFDSSPSPFSDFTPFFGNFDQNENADDIFYEQPLAATVEEIPYETPEPAHYMPSQYSGPTDFFTPNLYPQPSTSTYTCGTKRPNEFDDFEVAYKKKVTETEVFRTNEQSSDSGSPLEALFNESFLDSDQIESALNSLDDFDPSFLDLLNSTDVQDVLGQIEKEAEEEGQKLPVFDLSDYE
ncbi:neuronal PAS domain-containing protein 2 isoform X3 [Spodoptera frugiperda]|uniref:Neuronal PAS domain-containing protein 2 isoform X3 n=1 Tax=Spodoptera frugiperda TaxID=7108 RepID=A0A9R0EP40_SPOFR|nr:neuronal PAS domain-containing protein 2 isoform X3 [Spodoptera frugiperda]